MIHVLVYIAPYVCRVQPGNMLMKDYDGRTPLHVAIRDGSYQIIQHLIKQGASVHAKDRSVLFLICN